MNTEVFCDDPLGFTQEVSGLLSGLGCTNLAEFQKRNVANDDLKYLTSDDIEKLDPGKKFDLITFQRMSESLKRRGDKFQDPTISDINQLLGNAHRQIKLIVLYLKYNLKQLEQNTEDYFLDKDTNQKLSEAIIAAATSVMMEAQDFQNALKKFQVESNIVPKQESSQSRGIFKKNSYRFMFCVGLMFLSYKMIK